MSNALTKVETRALENCETVIESGIQTVYEVGYALRQIRNDRLYRVKYETFDDYCRERWEFQRTRAQQLISASEFIENLDGKGEECLPVVNIPDEENGEQCLPVVNTLEPNQLPNERQARELARYPDSKQKEIWAECLRRSGVEKVKAKTMQQVIADLHRGTSKVNGQEQPDPDDIAIKRAQGKMDADAVPEVEIIDPPPKTSKTSAGPGQAEADLSPEEKVASCRLNTLLSDRSLETFRSDAILYYKMAEPRNSLANAAKAHDKKSREKSGAYSYALRLLLSINPPDRWRKCPPKEHEGCDGVGTTMFGECSRCRGRGYLVR